MRTLARRLEGDLDSITMKALEKDRARRYASASEFRADIARHLRHEPVLARPPGAVYRFGKFARKHRGPVVAVAAVFVVLVASLVGMLGLNLRTNDALREARRLSYVANVSAAAFSLEDGKNAREARRRLGMCPEEFRATWEWRHFNLKHDLSLRVLWKGDPPGYLLSVAISPDGMRIITAYAGDETIRVWDAETLSQVLEIPWHGGIRCLALSPDGSLLAAGSHVGGIRVWNATGWDDITEIEGRDRPVTTLAFSPDGKLLASGAGDTQSVVRLWDVGTWKESLVLRVHAGEITSVAFSGDGKVLASTSSDETAILIWDTGDGRPIEKRDIEWGSNFARFHPVDGWLLSGSRDGQLRVWDAESWQEIRSISTKPTHFLASAFTRDGRHLAVVGDLDPTVMVWDTRSWEQIGSLRGHVDRISDIAFTPDGHRIVTGATDGSARIWDRETGDAVTTLLVHHGSVCMALSPDGRLIATASDLATVRIWDASTGDIKDTLRAHAGVVNCVAFGPDGRFLATGGADYTVRLWDVPELTEIAPPFEGHTGAIRGVAFSRDGTRLVSSSDDRTARIWEIETREVMTELTGLKDWDHSAVAFSPDGDFVVAGGSWGGEYTLGLLTADGGNCVSRLSTGPTSPVVEDVTFSPSGELIVAACIDTLLVWDAKTRELVKTMGGSVRSLAFFPDGTRLVAGSDDSTIRVWDTQTWDIVCTLRGEAEVEFVAVSPDGNRIFSLSADGSVRVWESELETARRMWWAAARRRRLLSLLGDLFEKHITIEKVISELEDDGTLSEEDRQIAIHLAQAHGGRN